MRIPIDQIRPTSTPIREVESEDIDALTQSIKEFGLLQPFGVRPVDDGYEVIFGNARLEAAKKAGLQEVEVVVADIDDDQALIEAGVENLMRTDMSEPEKGRWSLKVRERMGLDQQEWARRLGLSSSAIRNWEALATKLVPDLADLVAPPQRGGYGQEVPEGQLSGYQARQIARLESGRLQRRLAEKTMKERLPGEIVREVRQAIQVAPDEKTVEKILEAPWVRKAEEVIEEIEVEEVREERERREIAEEKKIRWERVPSTKDFLDILKMHQRLIRRGWQAAKDEKIAPDHLHYLTQRMKETVRILQDIIEQMEAKALERY